MIITISHVCCRAFHADDKVFGETRLNCLTSSRAGVRAAIEAWVNSWEGIGHVEIIAISTPYADDEQHCDIDINFKEV